jgi:hypothetical protein
MEVDLGRVLALNYASANLKWLAEIPVLESKGRSGLISSPPIPRMQQALAPRFMATEPVSGNAADSDLVFPMPGELVFRMPEGFQRFQTIVARSDSGEKRTALTLEIWQDDERIVSKTLGPDDESIPLEIAIAPNKKVRLVVDAPSQLRIGSRVTWKQPRLTR